MNETINKHIEKQKEMEENENMKLVPSLSDQSFSLSVSYNETKNLNISKNQQNEIKAAKSQAVPFSLDSSSKTGKMQTVTNKTPRILYSKTNSKFKNKN